MRYRRVIAWVIACTCGIGAGAQVEPEVRQIAQPIVIQNGTALERECAETAMAHVLATYRALGAQPDMERPCRITFQERVTVDGRVLDGVLGKYVPETSTVHMVSFDSGAFQQTDATGIRDPYTQFQVIIAHEIAHHFNSLLPVYPSPALDECIAGYIQFAWLDSETIDGLSAIHSGYRIRTLINISMLGYMDSPNDFLMAGYRYFCEHPQVLRRCLSGNPPPVRDPFVARN